MDMNIPESYIIHDIRSSKDFKGITISGYKRKDVINAYQNSMINSKLEDSIRWCVELHATGLNKIIWDSLKTLYLKSIHINNPKYFFYITKREHEYKKILQKYAKQHEIYTRNNQEIRNLYAELTAISCLTKKTAIILPKINDSSYDKEEIKHRMMSKNLEKISNFIYHNTSNEAKLGLNEIYKNLRSEKGTIQNCIYWYLWLEKIEHNKSKVNKINNRTNKNDIILQKVSGTLSQSQYFDNWTYILWEIIMSFNYNIQSVNQNNSIYLKKIMNIYKSDFKPSHISKKKYIFFIAFHIVKSNINWTLPLLINEYLIIQCNANINRMYENIIINNNSSLSEENIKKLRKLYNKSYYEMLNKKNNITIPKKIVNNDLNEEINKIEYTEYSDFVNLKKNSKNIVDDKKEDEINYVNQQTPDYKNLIYKNMTKKDVLDAKEELKNKKLNAFTQLVTLKKDRIMSSSNKNEESNQENYKSINFNKKQNSISIIEGKEENFLE
jgi:hypothetical protein